MSFRTCYKSVPCKKTSGWYSKAVLLLSCILLLSACALKSGDASTLPASQTASSLPLRGLVIDLDGKPIAGAHVSAREATGVTGQDGWFSLDTSGQGQWVTISHPAFIARTRAMRSEKPTLFRLTPQDGKTISLLFTGDVMFGRRFFDRNEDGAFSDGLIPEHPTLTDHLRLIEPIRPLLENADLTIINFESAISDDPSLNYLQARPLEYHLEKDYVYSSHSSALLALKQSGVDIINVANNHTYDLLDKGVEQTKNALEAAGFIAGRSYFGIGMSEETAWEPGQTSVKGQNFGFLGCTSITRNPLTGGPSYVADDKEKKGGAAACSINAMEGAVTSQLSSGSIPLAAVHGGMEYQREPSEYVVKLVQAARKAGAAVVIAHHPHVISGLNWDGKSLAAWSMGNFIFDQTLWPTFESMVLVVHMRDGKVIHAYTEPLIIEDFIPGGVVGADAEYVAREIAGHSSAGFVMEDGAIESDFDQQAVTHLTRLELKDETGMPRTVPAGERVSSFGGNGTLRLGRNLIWVGDFEDEDLDSQAGENRFWTLLAPDKIIGTAFAYEGQYGARLKRSASNQEPAILTPIHRVLIKAGDQITVSGMGRSLDQSPAVLQISWFTDTKGPSSTQSILPIKLEKDWTPFTLDLTVPEGVIAVGLYLKLSPPKTGFATADFDSLHLISWAAPDAPFSPLYDFYRVEGSGTIVFARDVLPGWDLFQKAIKP